MKQPHLISIHSEDTADQVLCDRFRDLTDQHPDQGVWAAYGFRSLAHGTSVGRPRRAYRLMVHLPSRPELKQRLMLFGSARWAAWRALTVVCGQHPQLTRLWAGKGMEN